MRELSVALARAAGVAEGGTPVILRPRPGMSIEWASMYLERSEQPPGVIVRVLHNLEPTTIDNMLRQFGRLDRMRAAGAADVPNIVIVTHAPAGAVEHALRRRVQVLDTTSAAVGTIIRGEPMREQLVLPAGDLDAAMDEALRAARGGPASSGRDLDADMDEALRAARGGPASSGRDLDADMDEALRAARGARVEVQRRPSDPPKGTAMWGEPVTGIPPPGFRDLDADMDEALRAARGAVPRPDDDWGIELGMSGP